VVKITRFAPSPTGRLHLGHAYSALMAHDSARADNGAFLLRIDDLDAGRVRPEYTPAILEDLVWLGLEPDAPAIIQSLRAQFYVSALERLKTMGLAYRCFCTRGQIAAQAAQSVAAPHDGISAVYPGTCRGISAVQSQNRAALEPHCWRLDMAGAVVQTGALVWHEAAVGEIAANPAAHGDIVLMRKDTVASYHLASTIDDADMAISHVVRGADLRASTDVHRLLQAVLGLPTPLYQHHLLIGGADMVRLAKRDNAAELAKLRADGVDPRDLVMGLRRGRLPLGYCWIRA
jgi:glutamyl-Q tRNA(Asp) synthetase